MNRSSTILLRVTIPLIIILVFLIQLGVSINGELTPWKGGGFGMYSDIHWANNQIWIGTKDKVIDGDSLRSILNVHERRYYGRVQRYPSSDNLNLLAKAISNVTDLDEMIIQVWKPRFSATSMRYERLKVNEIYFRK